MLPFLDISIYVFILGVCLLCFKQRHHSFTITVIRMELDQYPNINAKHWIGIQIFNKSILYETLEKFSL